MKSNLEFIGRQMLHAAYHAATLSAIKESAARFKDADEVLAFVTKRIAGASPVPTCMETPMIPSMAPASPDSDDVAAWIGSVLVALGYEIRFVFVSTPPRGVWVHVYVEAQKKDSDEEWVKYEYAPVNYTAHERVTVERVLS